MKKYFMLCLLFVSGTMSAQINLNKLEGDLNKAEKVLNTPNTTTPAATTTPNTNTTTPTAQNSGAGLSSLSDADVVQGLKDALSQGATTASKSLNVVDGYYKNAKVKIPFPEDAVHVANELRTLGYGKKVDDFEMTLNRSAEQAAVEAAPIFKNAITSMNFNDAKSILVGSDTAATAYLRKNTFGSLFTTFTPHIQKAIGDNLVTSKWAELTSLYNKLPTTRKKVNTDLVAYTTNKALKGLFILVAEEEGRIRKDPVARTTDILKKVFGSL
jgi:hypothetical protein